MFTTFVTSFVLVGSLLAASNDTINQPTCCRNNEYCCAVGLDCCPNSTTVKVTVALSDLARNDTFAQPTCCAQHDVCCEINAPCCGGSVTAKDNAVAVAPDGGAASQSFCCAKRAYCCSVKRSCCPKSNSVETVV